MSEENSKENSGSRSQDSGSHSFKPVSISSSLAQDQIKKLKKFIPKAKPAVSAKLRKILTPKQPVKKSNLVSGPISLDYRMPSKPYTNYPKTIEQFGHQVMNSMWRQDQRVKELQKQLADQKNQSGKFMTNIRDRLYVGPTTDSRQFIQDYDADFSTIAHSRPFKDKETVRSYVEINREVLKSKIALGYREDEISLIEATIRTEKKMFEIISRNFQKYVDLFQYFLLKDNKSMLRLARKAQEADTRLKEANDEFTRISKLQKGVSMAIYKSDSKWKLCKLCEHFLHSCSPMFWRKANRISATSIEGEESDDYGEAFFTSLIDKSDVEITLEDILETIERECRNHVVQDLYFTSPYQLLDMYEYMKFQNLNDLVQYEIIARPLVSIDDYKKTAERKFDIQIELFNTTIEHLEKEIGYEENRVKGLEELAHDLIFNHFKKLVSSTEVLKLYSYTEDLYESFFEPDSGNSFHSMIYAIQKFYLEQLSLQDSVPRGTSEKLQTLTIKKIIKQNEIIEKTKRQLVELNFHVKSMLKGFEPPYQKPHYKPLMFRSEPPEDSRPNIDFRRKFSDRELSYLEFFTDRCIDLQNPSEYDDLEENLSKILPQEEIKLVGKSREMISFMEVKK